MSDITKSGSYTLDITVNEVHYSSYAQAHMWILTTEYTRRLTAHTVSTHNDAMGEEVYLNNGLRATDFQHLPTTYGPVRQSKIDNLGVLRELWEWVQEDIDHPNETFGIHSLWLFLANWAERST